jgi:hypothetical protein
MAKLPTDFQVADMQKLIGKIAHLGEGAPWIYKIMLHVDASAAFALKQNRLLLLVCLPKF